MARRKKLILIPFIVFLSSCSSTLYLAKAAKYEILLLSREKKIEKILSDPSASPELKKKLRFVLEVRKFGKEKLGLTPGKSYTYYADIHIKTAAYVLTAVKSLSWEVKTFWFPIVGRVPYLGFPNLDDAKKYAEKLKKEGYDVSIGEATAFSTLGYLPDPVTPLMLKSPPLLLAELLLHEMTHATVYFSGETPFDENLAVMVENLGGIEFAENKWGRESDQYKYAVDKWNDTILFSDFLKNVRVKLDALFKSDIPENKKLQEKGKLLKKFQQKFDKLPFKSDYFKGFNLLPPNNARLLGWLIYYEGISELYSAFNVGKGNLKDFLRFLKRKPGKISPWEWIKRWKSFHG